MKFSDVSQESWEELRPYVDTCILPVTGLTGSEQPWEAVQALEELRDALDCLEIPYKGRVLTYPAYHFVPDQEKDQMLKLACRNLKSNGFRYVIVVSAKPGLELMLSQAEADLHYVVSPEKLNTSSTDIKQQILTEIQQLWSQKQISNIDTPV